MKVADKSSVLICDIELTNEKLVIKRMDNK